MLALTVMLFRVFIKAVRTKSKILQNILYNSLLTANCVCVCLCVQKQFQKATQSLQRPHGPVAGQTAHSTNQTTLGQPFLRRRQITVEASWDSGGRPVLWKKDGTRL